MGRWLASTEERPKLLKTTLLLERLSSLLLVTYLYLSGLRLLLETLGWNRVLTWLSSREFPPAPAPASQCNMSFSLWLESLVGDLTIFQETDPLALAWIGRRSLSQKNCVFDFLGAALERIFTVSFLYFTFSSKDGPNRFFPASGNGSEAKELIWGFSLSNTCFLLWTLYWAFADPSKVRALDKHVYRPSTSCVVK